MRRFLLLPIFLFFLSCASIPEETLTLSNAVIAEGERMHKLNISLVNSIFNDKRVKIDDFIKNEWTPAFLEEFQSRVPAGTDYQAEFPDMMEAVMAQTVVRRNTMQSALEKQRVKIITKLNEDYAAYQEAASALHELIESGIKVNEERRKALEKVTTITNGKIDVDKIETELDKFILNAGDVGQSINDLNNSIDSIIN